MTYLDQDNQTPDLQSTLKKNSIAVESAIRSLLSNMQQNTLKQASLYSCLENTGKKLRPSLAIEFTKILNGSLEIIMPVAASIEICHTYSLIHDDLPSLDNDDTRRGKPSCHKRFDEGTAILTGDTLLTYIFEILSSLETISPEKRCKLISELSKAIGHNGMLAGQIADIEFNKETGSLNEIINIHQLKTTKLIEFSCLSPTILFGTDLDTKSAIENFAKNFGILFQVVDDIEDYSHNSEEECNIVKSLGMNKSKELLGSLAEKAILSLDIFGNNASILKSLVINTASRSK